MALVDTGRSPDQPWGLVVSFKDRNEEKVLFVYPTKEQKIEKMSSIEDVIESMQITRKTPIFKSWKEGIRFGISLQSLGAVLSPKDESVLNVTIKVDALRFIGSWFKISKESEEYVSIAFVLSGHCSKDAVDSYILVTRQVCGAILSLENSSGFLREQLSIIQRIHESIDIDQGEGAISGNVTPFETCLRESSMLRTLQNIYEDVFRYGNNVMFLDEHVQLNVCIRSKSLLYCTLLPRTNSGLRRMLNNIKSYHTLIFIDDERPSPDKHPLLLSFLEHYSPERSFEEIRLDMRCTMEQLMLFVRNVVQWGRAVIAYPICLQNSYTIGAPTNVDLEELAVFYNQMFPEPSRVTKHTETDSKPPLTSALAEILEFFSPVVTLEEFFMNASRFLPRAANMETVVFLLKTGLIIQLHVHVQLIEPTHSWLQTKSISKDLSPRIKTIINHCNYLNEEFKEYLLYACSHILTLPLSEPDLFEALGIFIRLIPHFLQCEYMEKIVYETRITRANINRIVDLFSPMLFVYEVPAKL